MADRLRPLAALAWLTCCLAPGPSADPPDGPLSEAGVFAPRNLGGEPNRVVACCY